MSATYTKLKDGSWGVRVVGDRPAEGAEITVEKRSGERKTERVAKVLWSGTLDGRPVHLCAVAPGAPRCSGPRSGGRAVCAGCGRGGALVEDLEDGLMKHIGCCDIPPGGY